VKISCHGINPACHADESAEFGRHIDLIEEDVLASAGECVVDEIPIKIAAHHFSKLLTEECLKCREKLVHAIDYSQYT